MRIGHKHYGSWPSGKDMLMWTVTTLGLAIPVYLGWRIRRYVLSQYGRDITGEWIEVKAWQVVRP